MRLEKTSYKLSLKKKGVLRLKISICSSMNETNIALDTRCTPIASRRRVPKPFAHHQLTTEALRVTFADEGPITLAILLVFFFF